MGATKKLIKHFRNLMDTRVSSPSSGTHQGAQVLKPLTVILLGLLTSQKKGTIRQSFTALRAALSALAILSGGLLFTHSAYAASYINVSSGAPDGLVSFSKVQPSSAGEMSTASDTLTINTNCSAGYNVYVSAINGGETSLVNDSASAAAAGNNTISASSATIGGTAVELSANTWGINASNTDVSDGRYFGLPAYSSAIGSALVAKSDVETESTVPIYYGAKVTTALAPGSYNGDVLYTVLSSTGCSVYTIIFNANGGSGEMDNQSINVGQATALSANTFTRSGYTFLGWSNSANGKTGTAVDGVGTAADVDYENEESVTDISDFNTTKTLYAIWEETITGDMQNFNCNALSSGATAKLRDTRDGQLYSVYRIPTDNAATNVAGKCIMTKDLNLGAVASASGSSSTIVANGTMTLSPNDSNFATPSGSGESITVPTSNTAVNSINVSGWSSSDSYSNKQYIASGTGDYAGRGYYSWGAAMVACPKGWRLPTNAELNNSSSWNASKTGISKAVNNSLNTLQSSPWSFVLGGLYSSSSFYDAPSNGYYWSSTQYNSGYSYSLHLNSSNGLRWVSYFKSYELAVRCIADGWDGIMQEFESSANLPNTGDSAILKDTRDNKLYTVKRLPDGKVWMMNNLSISNVAMTSSDTNIAENATFDLTSGITYSGPSGWCRTDDSDCSNVKAVYAREDSNGYLYNWYTATAGNGTHGTNSSVTINYDICPKGWHLPVGGDNTTSNQFALLDIALGGTGINRSSANTYSTMAGIFPRAGYIYGSLSDVGTYGNYWSSTAQSNSNAYNLFLYSSNQYVYPRNNYFKIYGYSVRCIAQNNYMVSYNANGGSGEASKISETFYESGSITAASQGSLTRDGYSFLGWSLDQNVTSATYVANSAIDVAALLSAAGSPTVGSTITLYAVWESYDADMQSWTGCASLPSNQSLKLRDTRNGRVYTVKKLPDGKCWMMNNLSISNVMMTSSDTNLATNATFDLTSGIKYSRSSGWCGTNSAACNNVKAVYAREDSNGYLYNWYTATAGNGTHSTGADVTINYDICPKGWHLPVGGEFALLDIAFGGTGANRTSANTYSTMTNIFPLAGLIGSSLGQVGTSGNYWSSTAGSNYGAYFLRLYSDNQNVYPRYHSNNKHGGYSVRCVAKEPTMQETSANDLSENATTSLVDSRDDQSYTVYRWPSTGAAGTDYPTGMAGSAIMTQDLALGYVTGGSVTKGANLSLDTSTSAGSGTITARAGTSDWSGTNDDSNLQYINGTGGTYDSHSYYSYGAAQKVCPKGWRPPTNTEYSNIITFMGGNNSTGLSKITSAPYNFVYGGLFNSGGWGSVGSRGYYWSSTQNSSTYGYNLNFDLSELYAGYTGKYNGFSVRCVASS